MALRAHARGGPEQLVYEQAPAPVPGPGDALVAVHAAAISFGVHAMFFVVTPGPAELTRLAELADNGQLRTTVSRAFPLRDGRRAFESEAQPRPPGKTVLIVR
jgi:NADPH:quinone reductase-like Zn-dependent oxidoreductase